MPYLEDVGVEADEADTVGEADEDADAEAADKHVELDGLKRTGGPSETEPPPGR